MAPSGGTAPIYPNLTLLLSKEVATNAKTQYDEVVTIGPSGGVKTLLVSVLGVML